MAKKHLVHLIRPDQEWGGVNTTESEKGNRVFLEEAKNIDSNINSKELVGRKGMASRLGTTSADIDMIHEYRDRDWGNDVLVLFDKDSTTADRTIEVHTRTIGGTGNYTKQGNYSYGDIEFADDVEFITYRNSVRIGSGTGANNKPVFLGRVDRTGENGMFGESDFDVQKILMAPQQFVQKSDTSTCSSNIVYHSGTDTYARVTQRGLEFLNSDFQVDEIIDDIAMGFASFADHNAGVSLSGDTLIAFGVDKGSTDTKVISVDMEGREVSTSTYSKSQPDEITGAVTDGTNIWIVWNDATTGYITETSMSFGAVANRVASATYIDLKGACTDGTYIFTHNRPFGGDTLIRMLIASPYTVTPYVHGLILNGADGLEVSGANLYLGVATDVYSVPISGFASNTNEVTLGGHSPTVRSISFLSGVPYVSWAGGFSTYDDATNWNETKRYPGKAYIRRLDKDQTELYHADQKTYFYGLSFETLDGQHTHLMKDFVVVEKDDSRGLIIAIDALGQTYEELNGATPSQDPSNAVSIWNVYQRFKKVHLWRAYSATPNDSYPTSEYRFLKTFDIDDFHVNNPSGSNYDYAFILYTDRIDESEMSSITYETFTGIPVAVTREYVNWAHATESQGSFYYGNVRTEEVNAHKIIQAPAGQPDSLYETAANIALFGFGDGDEIRRMGSLWNRLLVMKSQRSAAFSGLTQDRVFDVGIQAPRSLMVVNDVAYFVFADGVYSLVPGGAQRISQPVDDLLANESMDDVSAAYFYEKQKIWFQVKAGQALYGTFLWNLNTGTWDYYDTDTISLGDNQYVIRGVDYIYTSDATNGQVNEQNTGRTDLGNDIQFDIRTKHTDFGANRVRIHRIYPTYRMSGTSAEQITLSADGMGSSRTKNLTTIPDHITLRTRKFFTNGLFAQAVNLDFLVSTDAEFIFRNVIYEVSGGDSVDE